MVSYKTIRTRRSLENFQEKKDTMKNLGRFLNILFKFSVDNFRESSIWFFKVILEESLDDLSKNAWRTLRKRLEDADHLNEEAEDMVIQIWWMPTSYRKIIEITKDYLELKANDALEDACGPLYMLL